jgi:mono/diheme cytochrome c family protein
MQMRKVLLAVIGLVAVALIGFGLLQLVPYGHNHINPPVATEPAWDSAQTRALAVRACFDCHSDETTWPWYSNVAPASWLIQHDVDEGRQRLNFSEWNRPQRERRRLASIVMEGEMPPWYYVILHPTANLSNAETQQLADGLNATK